MLPVSLALTLAFLGCGCFGCCFFSLFFGDSIPRKGTIESLLPGLVVLLMRLNLCQASRGWRNRGNLKTFAESEMDLKVDRPGIKGCSFWRIRFWAAYAQICRGLVAKEHSQLSGRHHNAIDNFQLENKIVLHMQLPQQGTLTQPLCCDLQTMSCKTQ